jgi:hypothetical protein
LPRERRRAREVERAGADAAGNRAPGVGRLPKYQALSVSATVMPPSPSNVSI